MGVVEGDLADHRDRSFHDVGRVPRAAEPNLYDGYINRLLDRPEEIQRGHHLEVGESFAHLLLHHLEVRPEVGEDSLERVSPQRSSGDGDPFGWRDEVGRGIGPDRKAGRAQKRRDDAGDRRLAVRAGYVNGRDRSLGMIEGLAQSLDTVKRRPHRLHRVDPEGVEILESVGVSHGHTERLRSCSSSLPRAARASSSRALSFSTTAEGALETNSRSASLRSKRSRSWSVSSIILLSLRRSASRSITSSSTTEASMPLGVRTRARPPVEGTSPRNSTDSSRAREESASRSPSSSCVCGPALRVTGIRLAGGMPYSTFIRLTAVTSSWNRSI